MLLHVTIPPFPRRPPTRAACEVACRLGVILDQLEHGTPACSVAIELDPGARVLITGPSGSGKSRLLNAIESAMNSRGIHVVRPPAALPGCKPCIESLGRCVSIDDAMRALASAGLADASVMIRRNGELSTGQSERLRLARAMLDASRSSAHGAKNPGAIDAAIVIDEFGSTLDDATLGGVARMLLAHSARRPDTAIVLATHRDQVREVFAPTTIVALDNAGQVVVTTPGSSRTVRHRAVSITNGTRADLDALARHHYRTHHPATIDRVFRATERRTGALIGVLTLSMPTLNAAWRSLAWPGRYDTRDKRFNAKRLNAEIRCISRVIVAPAFRGIGVARALVAHALAHAPTPGVEALAALGCASPVFIAAGMTAYPVPCEARDARLLDLLHEAGLDAWRLATPATALPRTVDALGAALLERELRRWASLSRSTRSKRGAPLPVVFEAACRRLAQHRHAYAWCRAEGAH